MEDINVMELEDLNQEGKLTDENVKDILNTMKEIADKSEDIKVLNDIKNSKLMPGEEGTVNEVRRTFVKIDPNTGVKVNLGASKEVTNEELNVTLEDKFKDVVDDESNIIMEDNFSIEPEDISRVTNDIFNIPEEQQDENKLSTEDTLKIMEIIDRVKSGEKFNIYNEFPDRIKEMVDNTLHLKGYGDSSVQSKTVRNAKCLEIISAYIGLISREKYNNSFVKKIEEVQQDDNLKLSELYSDYEANKTKFLTELMDSLEEDDPRRETVATKLDILEDSYSLRSLIEFASTHRVKMKHIDYEKPQQRIFNTIESKYRYNPNLNIVSLSNVYNILTRHNKKEDKENLKFFAAFCKMCENMDIENSDNHLYIYSVLRNIIYLDVYKEDEYKKFAPSLLANIDKVISLVR